MDTCPWGYMAIVDDQMGERSNCIVRDVTGFTRVTKRDYGDSCNSATPIFA